MTKQRTKSIAVPVGTQGDIDTGFAERGAPLLANMFFVLTSFQLRSHVGVQDLDALFAGTFNLDVGAIGRVELLGCQPRLWCWFTVLDRMRRIARLDHLRGVRWRWIGSSRHPGGQCRRLRRSDVVSWWWWTQKEVPGQVVIAQRWMTSGLRWWWQKVVCTSFTLWSCVARAAASLLQPQLELLRVLVSNWYR